MSELVFVSGVLVGAVITVTLDKVLERLFPPPQPTQTDLQDCIEEQVKKARKPRRRKK